MKEIVQKKESCEHQEECMKMVQKVVDGQATPEEIESFKENMKSCLPCENGFALETCLKETIQLRLDKKCVPMSLIECIKKSIGH
ncbi:MAG: hypothetical protein V4683_12800 [Bacteroidota bacterium]